MLTFGTAAVVLELPDALVDAFGPFEERVIEVVDWTTSENGTAQIRAADGETFSGPNAFGVVTYKAMPSGTYDVLLTAATHTVVAATPRR